MDSVTPNVEEGSTRGSAELPVANLSDVVYDLQWLDALLDKVGLAPGTKTYVFGAVFALAGLVQALAPQLGIDFPAWVDFGIGAVMTSAGALSGASFLARVNRGIALAKMAMPFVLSFTKR